MQFNKKKYNIEFKFIIKINGKYFYQHFTIRNTNK